jgi:quercetin dioxygenase-like cupin family protein
VIQGKLKPIWKIKDYKDIEWRSNEDHYNHFKTSKNNAKKFKDSVGVYINNNVGDVFEKVAQKFNLDKTVVALNKMSVGQILPWHKDKYATYIKRNKIKRKKDIIRIIVFLEDSMPGHQLWINDKFCYGKAGSYFGWPYNTKHMAANIGETDRYTLQITGIKNGHTSKS